jgi:hypothetical protein
MVWSGHANLLFLDGFMKPDSDRHKTHYSIVGFSSSFEAEPILKAHKKIESTDLAFPISCLCTTS